MIDHARTPDSASALDAVLSRATWVRVVRGAEFDHQHRKANETIVTERDPAELVQLRDALRINADSLQRQAAWMTPGELTFGFYADSREFLTSVTYLFRGWVRWSGWSADAELAEPDQLESWLANHSWQPPPTDGANSE